MGYRLLKVFVWVALAAAMPLRAQMPLSEEARASVSTCGPGDDFYTSFGHSAIRICDAATGRDVVFNYGMFDFGDPNVYWHFMQGRLRYWVDSVATPIFLEEYRRGGRAVWEQELNLTPQEVNNLYLKLQWNAQGENRYYDYDFFTKNCATEVRDRVLEVCGHKRAHYGVRERMSYRDYLHLAMKDKLEWWALGVDLLLGLPADEGCSADDAMFYPLVMQGVFAEAERDGRPLAGPSRQLLEETRGEVADSFPPFVVFTLLFVLVVLSRVCDRRLNCRVSFFKVLTRVLFVVAGLIGLFLLFMWFGTNHYCTQWNPNILWASPMLLWIAIYMEKTPRGALWAQLGMFAVALVWVVWCHLSVALIPIIFTLALCTGLLLRDKS